MESDAAASRPWVLRCAAPLVIFAANAFGFAFTNARLAEGALAVAYTTALTAALGVRPRGPGGRAEAHRAAARVGGGAVRRRVERAPGTTRALKELCSSVRVAGLGVAWLLHALGVTSSVLVLQTCASSRTRRAAARGLAPERRLTLPRLPADRCCCWRRRVARRWCGCTRAARQSRSRGCARPWRTEPEEQRQAARVARRPACGGAFTRSPRIAAQVWRARAAGSSPEERA
jgi:hypothetical protein